MSKKAEEESICDGCTAAAHVAYANSDTSFIFPITPSTAMAEAADMWAYQKRKNIFGQVTGIRQMQSEAGAAGAVHGSLVVGCLTTTFTASQGLLLMLPNMYKIAGELTPCVFHVSARAVATQALSIFGDHSDVMAVRQCGWAILSSSNVQEAMDLAQVAHMATLKARVPFIHFFDGFRISHELQKIKMLDNETIYSLIDHEAVQQFRNRGLNPTKPMLIGTSQGPEVYFQNLEAANQYYAKVGSLVKEQMKVFGEKTGRFYELFSYFGDPEATHVVIIMGAGSPVCHEVVEYYMRKRKEEEEKKKEKNEEEGVGVPPRVGVITVHLFRPWCLKEFIAVLPSSVQRIAVLDRTKESGALGEPLYLDVAASLQVARKPSIQVFGGRYGLGSKDFTSSMAFAIFENIFADTPKESFTVGIEDDITHLSLAYKCYRHINTVPKETTECMFWGFGSDGTVSANKNVIKIIGDNTPLQVQGYFAYSAHKAGGLTVSHLRFGKSKITSQYLIQQADYLACHRDAYVSTFDMLSYLKPRGVFVLNCPWTDEQLVQFLPAHMRREIAKKEFAFYTIDANAVATKTGMGRRINNILMTVFFRLSGVLPFEEAIALFKRVIQKTYGKKGMHVVEANWKAVDAALDLCHKVSFDKEEWASAQEPVVPSVAASVAKRKLSKAPDFVNSVLLPLERLEGNDLPTSTFAPFVGGRLPLGSSAFEKRGIAINVPIVDMELCTQCNYCSFVCPHAAIRPFLVDEEDAEKAPEQFVMKKAKGASEIAPYKYRIQVSPLDCTGCELCSIACPANCLKMTPLPEVQAKETESWNFAINLFSREELCENTRHTIKGSQFYQPLMEFSGACEGCGETPYVKLLTQLFGERMIIANATGCSSIWGASYPSNPYTTNQKGYGPAWGNSLFEDNAEYGYGMVIALEQRRKRFHTMVQNFLNEIQQPKTTTISATTISATTISATTISATNNQGNDNKTNNTIDNKTIDNNTIKSVDDNTIESVVGVGGGVGVGVHLTAILSKEDLDPVLYEGLEQYRDHWLDDPALCHKLFETLQEPLEKQRHLHPSLEFIYQERDMFPKFSHWIIGGDGWAYDIGYSGLDHVVASGINVNILVLDTEVYSNTGGQTSKATPLGAVHKFSTGGNMKNKKDLGMICMQYGNVYVASVASSANLSQTIRTFVEAEKFYGPSVILAYAPCIEHGYIKPFSAQQVHCTMAVESGYWPLYRYNPELEKQGLPPLQLDSKKLKGNIREMLIRENRFAQLKRSDPKLADAIEADVEQWVTRRFNLLKAKAEGLDSIRPQKEEATAVVAEQRVHVLYGSETGNAEEVANRVGSLIRQAGLKAKVLEMSEVEPDDLAEMDQVLVVVSTAGQGEFPANAKQLYEDLCKHGGKGGRDGGRDGGDRGGDCGGGDCGGGDCGGGDCGGGNCGGGLLSKTRYAVFGLGDSSYIFFNEAAKKFDAKFEELGAKRLILCGLGDDQDEDKFDYALAEWLPLYWKEAQLPEATNKSDDPDTPMYCAEEVPEKKHQYKQCVPAGATLARLVVNRRITPENYQVEVRHLEFDLSGSGIKYSLGDSLAIYPQTDETTVTEFCQFMQLNPDVMIRIKRAGEESSAKHEALFKHPMTIRQLLTECLDITAKPNRRFYETFYKFCEDPEQKNTAKHLLDDKERLQKLAKEEFANCFDIIKKFPSILKLLRLEHLIDLIPLHKPRYYSIASSQKFVGPNKLDLCIGIVDWTTSTGLKRFGGCTGYIRRLSSAMSDENRPLFLACAVKSTAFNMPPNDSYPIIMAGMGTGLAPFRAFIQHRAFLKRSGKPCGPVVLYFGCRYSKKDYLYGEELQAYEKEGVITDLKVAFSRDQREKFYVQHHIDKDPALLYKRLVTEKGFFYLCGSAKQVPIDIRAAIVRAITKEKGVTADEADRIVMDMQIKGQYNVEAW